MSAFSSLNIDLASGVSGFQGQHSLFQKPSPFTHVFMSVVFSKVTLSHAVSIFILFFSFQAQPVHTILGNDILYIYMGGKAEFLPVDICRMLFTFLSMRP